MAPNGINIDVFKKQKKTMKEVLFEQTRELIWSPKSLNGLSPSKEVCGGYKNVVKFVGKFAEWKRQSALLKAASIYEKALPGGSIATLCAGTGPEGEQKQLTNLCNELDLQHTYMLGARPQPILAEVYSVADIGVFPSYKEPFGLVFVECMACGTPVIGANSGGPKDFVTPDVGELVPEPSETTDLNTVLSGIETLSNSLNDVIQRAIREGWKEKKAEIALNLLTIASQLRPR